MDSDNTLDGILQLAADVARKAIADYQRGPDYKHYHSAAKFLQDTGLINRLAGAPPMNTDDAQPKPNLVDQYIERRNDAAAGKKPPIKGDDLVSKYLRHREETFVPRPAYQAPMRPED